MHTKTVPDTIPNPTAQKSPETELLQAQVRFLEEMLIAKEHMIGELARELQRARKRTELVRS